MQDGVFGHLLTRVTRDQDAGIICRMGCFSKYSYDNIVINV